MSKKTKYILSATALLMLEVVAFSSEKASAILGGKAGNFFKDLFTKRVRNAVGNVGGSTENRLKLSKLAYESTVGIDSSDFNKSGVGIIMPTKLYHQNGDAGNVKNVVSEQKPIVLAVSGNKVITETTKGRKKIILNSSGGAPVWLKGKDIIESEKNKLDEKMRRYFESSDGITPDPHYNVKESLIEKTGAGVINYEELGARPRTKIKSEKNKSDQKSQKILGTVGNVEINKSKFKLPPLPEKKPESSPIVGLDMEGNESLGMKMERFFNKSSGNTPEKHYNPNGLDKPSEGTTLTKNLVGSHKIDPEDVDTKMRRYYKSMEGVNSPIHYPIEGESDQASTVIVKD